MFRILCVIGILLIVCTALFYQAMVSFNQGASIDENTPVVRMNKDTLDQKEPQFYEPAVPQIDTAPIPLHWAVICSPEVQDSGLGDMLMLQLSSSEKYQMVDREDVEKAITELEISTLFEESSIACRLELGRILGAERLIILHQKKNDKGVRLVVIDAPNGATLLSTPVPYTDDDLSSQCEQIALIVDDVRNRYAYGVLAVLAIPDFLSLTFLQDYDYLQRDFPGILSSALTCQPGIAIVSLEEFQAIRQELDLIGEGISRIVPLQIRGEYRINQDQDRTLEAVHMKIEIFDGVNPLKTFEVITNTEKEIHTLLQETVPYEIFVLLKQEKRIIPLTSEQQKEELIKRADEYQLLGFTQLMVRHLEAAYLLDPNDKLLCWRLTFGPVPGKRQLELIESVFQRKMMNFSQGFRMFTSGWSVLNTYMDEDGRRLTNEEMRETYSPIHATHPLEEDYYFIRMAPLIYRLPRVENGWELQPGLHPPGAFDDRPPFPPRPEDLKNEEMYFRNTCVEKVMRYVTFLDGMRKSGELDKEFADEQIRNAFRSLIQVHREIPEDQLITIACYSDRDPQYLSSDSYIVIEIPEFLDYIDQLRKTGKKNLALVADCLNFALEVKGPNVSADMYEKFLALETRVIETSKREWEEVGITSDKIHHYVQNLDFIAYKLSLLLDLQEINIRVARSWQFNDMPKHIRQRLARDGFSEKELREQNGNPPRPAVARQPEPETPKIGTSDFVFTPIADDLLPDGLYLPIEQRGGNKSIPLFEGITPFTADSDLMWNTREVFHVTRTATGAKPTSKSFFKKDDSPPGVYESRFIFQVLYDGKFVWVVTTARIVLLDSSGTVLSEINEQTGLPPFFVTRRSFIGLEQYSKRDRRSSFRYGSGVRNEWGIYPERFRGTPSDDYIANNNCFLHAWPVAEGECIVVGCFGDQMRSWIARIRYEDGLPKPNIKILHTATHVSPESNLNHEDIPYIYPEDKTFECRWTCRFDDPLFPKRRQVLVSREYGSRYMDIPLLVDLDTDEVCLLTDRYPDLKDLWGGLDVRCINGNLVLVESNHMKIFFRGESGNYESFIYQWSTAPSSEKQTYRFCRHDHVIHYPGKDWYRIDLEGSTPKVDIFHASLMPPVTSYVDFVDSNVYGLVAIGPVLDTTKKRPQTCQEDFNCRCGRCRRIVQFHKVDSQNPTL